MRARYQYVLCIVYLCDCLRVRVCMQVCACVCMHMVQCIYVQCVCIVYVSHDSTLVFILPCSETEASDTAGAGVQLSVNIAAVIVILQI